MKTVQSIADLKDHALRNGASVELGGSRFNTERARLNTPSFRSPTPVSGSHTPAADPMQSLVMALVAKQLADAQASDGKGYELIADRIASAITEALASAQRPAINVQAPTQKFPEAPRKWTFAINRDDEGRMTSITASAT
jgi:hypothetical protein